MIIIHMPENRILSKEADYAPNSMEITDEEDGYTATDWIWFRKNPHLWGMHNMDNRTKPLAQRRSQVPVLFRPLKNPYLWGFLFTY
jgi:hypothetical protein